MAHLAWSRIGIFLWGTFVGCLKMVFGCYGVSILARTLCSFVSCFLLAGLCPRGMVGITSKTPRSENRWLGLRCVGVFLVSRFSVIGTSFLTFFVILAVNVLEMSLEVLFYYL